MNYENFLDETKELWNQGEALLNEGNGDEAVECFEKALKVQVDKYGTEHESTVACLTQLGMCHLVNANYESARDTINDALNIAKKLFGHECKELGNLYYLLGTAYMQLGDAESAAREYYQLVSTSKKLFGEHAQETMAAVAVYNKAMAKVGGSDIERKTIDAMTDEEECYAKANKTFEDGNAYLAPHYFNKAIALRTEAGHEDDRLVEYYRALAVAYTELDMNDEALSTLDTLLALAKKLHGDVDISVSGTHNLIGYNYMVKGDYDKAIDNLNKCITIDIKIYGEKSIEVVRDYNILASMYRMSGSTEKALATYIIVENLAAMTEDESARDVLVNVYTDMAALYMESQNYESAHEYIHKKLHLCMHLFGKVSPQTYETYNQLLSIASHMNNDEEIAEVLKAIDEIREAASHEEHHHDGCTCGCHDHHHEHADNCCDDDCDCHHDHEA